MTCGAWLMFSMPAGQRQPRLAEADHLRRGDDGLDAGAAEPVHGERRDFDGHARP